MSALTTEELTILKSVFDKFDKDKTEKLSCDQFKALLKTLGKYQEEIKDSDNVQIEALFSFLDKKSSGELEYSDLVEWWSSPDKFSYLKSEDEENKPGTAKLLRKAYILFSKYSSEHIPKQVTYTQFDRLLDGLNIRHSQFVFDSLDKNDDGLLNFREFCLWLRWF